MKKTNTSARSRKTKRSLSSKRKKNIPKTPQNSDVKPVAERSPLSSNSETSPFKGFILENSNVEVQKEDLFDRLVDEEHPVNLHRNIRTYSNKNKLKKRLYVNLLEFENDTNRDEVIRWLNDNRNAFDRLTQTQSDTIIKNVTDTQMTFDMPSVSQEDVPKANHSYKEKGKSNNRRSPYRLRAKSLDVQIKKNGHVGRSRSYSLAGDAPNLESYDIEEFGTDDESFPAINDAKAFVDLIEDEYLNNLEREITNNNKNKSVKKKEPKQLKIVVSPKKNIDRVNNNLHVYKYDVLENYFVENMNKLLQESINEEEENNIRNKNNHLKNIHTKGTDFLNSLKDLIKLEGNAILNEFKPLISELKNLGVNLQQSATQTRAIQNFEKNVQTELRTVNVFTQTYSNPINVIVQTEQNLGNKFTQTEIKKMNIEIQTENVESSRKKIRKRCNSEASTNSEILFLDEKECQEMATDFPAESDKDEIFNDDLDFDFDTEDILKNVQKKEAEDAKKSGQKSGESILEVSAKTGNGVNKGVKRQISQCTPMDYQSKRPCARFIKNDLSLEFASCMETEGRGDSQEENEAIDNLLKIAKNEQIMSKEINAKNEDFDYFEPAPYSRNSEENSKSRRSLFNFKPESPQMLSESPFLCGNNDTVVPNRTLTNDNDNVIEENLTTKCQDSENHKIKILENIILKAENLKDKENDCDDSQDDIIDATPQKDQKSSERVDSSLDITLPPPHEFQDEMDNPESIRLSNSIKILTTPRRPLAAINKVTSTPYSQKPASENFLSLSPIVQENKKSNPATPNQSMKRTPEPYETADQHLGKYAPLTIIKKAQSLENFAIFTPPKQKTILNYMRQSQEAKSPRAASFESTTSKPCIASSRVKKEEVIAISSLTNKKLVSFSGSFTPKVTHLIVSVNDKNCLIDHTMKYVSAVASGIWVLNPQWVHDCVVKNSLVPEEPYEVLDTSGCPGPRISRLTRRENPLFKGYKIYAAPPFVSTTQQEIENVIKLLGGKVVPSPEHLLDKNGYVCVIVTEARATQDFEIFETWLEALKVVTVDIEWLSRSVGQYKLLSLRPFSMCSDDGIEGLGYPPELTANMAYSFSQQTFTEVPSSTKS